MKDELLAMNEYQGLNLPPCHKQLENCTKYMKQMFSDIHNRKWSIVNPERGENKQGESWNGTSLYLEGNFQRIPQKGGIQIEPGRLADLRRQPGEAKMASNAEQRKCSIKSAYKSPGEHQYTQNEILRPSKEQFWGRKNYY